MRPSKQYYLKDIEKDPFCKFADRGMEIPDAIYVYDVKNKTAFTYLRPKELYDKEPHSLNLGWKNGDKKLIELWNKILRPIIYENKSCEEKDVIEYLEFYEFWKNIVGLAKDEVKL